MDKVLIIDDDKTLLEMYKLAFELKNIGVDTVPDGRTGINKALEKPKVILLDIMMPEMDGIEVLQELKKNPDTKNIPVLMLTNLDTDKEKQMALVCGADAYLVKSDYTPGQIIEKTLRFISPNNN